ncbi:MAG: hypothetical protein WBD07_03430 [Vicinamibacterales bacterium]
MHVRSLHDRILILGSLLVLVTLIAACDSPLAPSFQPEITNATDNFQAQATGVTTTTTALTYFWQNTGTRATINHSTTTTAGVAHITLKDAAGTVVYDKDLVPSLNEPTATGTPGAWTIQLQLVSYSGTLNFRAQKL